jgi:inward rectifier potassium channel
MALLRGINQKQKTVSGSNATVRFGRFINKNGTANIERRGMHLLHRIIWYHAMIIPAWNLSYYFVFFMGIFLPAFIME